MRHIDTLVIGAPWDDSGTNSSGAPDSGAVHVFRRSAAGWQQAVSIKPSNTEAGDRFGISLALDGDTLAVGSSARELDHPGQGAVYMFRRSDTGWQEEPHVVVASEPHESSRFGAMALEGDTLVIGAPVDGPDDARADLYESGAIYVFQRVRE